jgi:molybdenum-dependent DNA-binding transcriptional regulator ModE
MSAPLGTVLSIPAIAKLAGWDRTRMWRHLKRLDSELGGMLLQRARGQKSYTVRLSALQAIAPQWFTDPESVASAIEELRAETADLRRDVEHLRAIVNIHTEALSGS